MLNRFVDTEIPFKKHWYAHPRLFGRSSIKLVLPLMAPGFGYADMAIADGSAASIMFENLTSGLITGDEADLVRRNLLDYCRLDSLAMLKIVDRLRELAE